MFISEVPAPSEIIAEIGQRFKEYRLRLHLTQKEISEFTLISIPTIYKFENGKLTDMSTSNLFKLLRAVGLLENWKALVPELPDSPYMYNKEKKKQRVKHSKNEHA